MATSKDLVPLPAPLAGTLQADGPLTPRECDVATLPFMPLLIYELEKSDAWRFGNSDERAASLSLQIASWKEVPAASLPNDDRALSILSRSECWATTKSIVLRDWKLATDGRLYHKSVAQCALESWIKTLLQRISGMKGNAIRWKLEIDLKHLKAQVAQAAEYLWRLNPQSRIFRDQKTLNKIISESDGESGGDRHKHRQSQSQSQSHRHHDVDERSNHIDPATPRLDAKEISENLCAWEAARTKTLRNHGPENDKIIHLARLDLTITELRIAYDQAVSKRADDNEAASINAGLILVFVEKNRQPKRPKRKASWELRAMDLNQLVTYARNVGVGDAYPGEGADSYIARILAYQA
ncbi:hypothetical protein [Paraburkholderia bryophila]|uniref:DUF1376 domain-containing protein n=1 Tax=Paraburkholderia bryophila TaxID=420952 RepID=A0A329CD79_9BURK|nr:hypothetical protein [Paraburkholderia bryophila]RAS32067.1 hypothetical protein BX591_108175 [Paraburkholderia bryophila]